MNYALQVCVVVAVLQCLILTGTAWRMGSANKANQGYSFRVVSMDCNKHQPGDVVGAPMIPRALIVKQSLPAMGSMILASLLSFSAPVMADDRPPKMRRAVRPLAYSVEMTDPPCLQPRSTKGEESALQRLAASDALLLGLHDHSPVEGPDEDEDVKLTLLLLQRILKKLPRGTEVVLGIADIARTEASTEALQRYLQSNSVEQGSSQLLPELPQRWLPILKFAKASKLAVAPMGLPEAVVQAVSESGLQGLDDSQKSDFVPDAEGFLQSVLAEGFKRYSDSVITSRFEEDSSNRRFASIENYFSFRILRQEYIATLVARRFADASKEQGRSSKELVILLAPESDIKFGLGVEERVKRSLNRVRADSPPSSSSSRVYSLLLNPSAADSLSDTAQLRLVLAYGPLLRYQRPLADFLWFSEYPPVRLLTRTKNPIDREGDKPAGESSILGAF